MFQEQKTKHGLRRREASQHTRHRQDNTACGKCDGTSRVGDAVTITLTQHSRQTGVSGLDLNWVKLAPNVGMGQTRARLY